MDTHPHSSPRLAAEITRAASLQTYFTIRCLVDRGMVDDAFRAYAYFRWVDDWLDSPGRPRDARLAFARRQQELVEKLYRREQPDVAALAPEERLLVDLVQNDRQKNSGLQAYIRNMMAIMVFDAERRGRLITHSELSDYTRWLAVAVTEALHHFIGHGCAAPTGSIRYLAVTGAHITHLLRDTLDDLEAGYFNVPADVLASAGIAPEDVDSPAYREWVKRNVHQARACFKSGRDHLAQVRNFRCRFAGYAYIRRFEVVLDCIERDGYRLRRAYPERKRLAGGLVMFAWATWKALFTRQPHGFMRDRIEVKQ